MPSDATMMSSDSQNPSALPPLKCKASERPPVIFTPAAIVEMREAIPTLAIEERFGSEVHYYCPFCNSECSRDYCWGCKSDLLEDDQDE